LRPKKNAAIVAAATMTAAHDPISARKLSVNEQVIALEEEVELIPRSPQNGVRHQA
jgi:hypothetical protein